MMLMSAILVTAPSSMSKRSADAVALQRRDRGLDHRAVEAAPGVLALQLLLGAVEQRLVVDLGLLDPGLLQAVLQVVLGELLRALDLDGGDRRALLHEDDEHVAVGLEAHVGIEPGGVERLDRGRGLVVVDAVADLDRQVGEDGPGFRALYTLDADVADDEGLDGEDRKRGGQETGEKEALQGISR
jgi:hypothetical protein